MKNWLQILLSVFGAMLAIISFFVSEVEHLPSLLCYLCPKHPTAMKGIEKLETLEESQSFDFQYTGFTEVGDIAMELLKEGDTSTDFSHFMIEKFECLGQTSLNVGFDAGSFVGKGFYVHLVDRWSIDIVKRPNMKKLINNNQLRKKLEERLESNLLHWRFGFFFAGILLIQIPIIICQLRKGQKKKS